MVEWVRLAVIPRTAQKTFIVRGVYGEVHTRSRMKGERIVEVLAYSRGKNIAVYGYASRVSPDTWRVVIGVELLEKGLRGLEGYEIARYELAIRCSDKIINELLDDIVSDLCGVIRARYPTAYSWTGASIVTNVAMWKHIHSVIARDLKKHGVEVINSYPESIKRLVEKLKASE